MPRRRLEGHHPCGDRSDSAEVELRKWYVNFEHPTLRTEAGFDTFGLTVGLVVTPDLTLNRSGFGRDSIISEDRVMARPSPYPLELRRRAVRMIAGVRPDYDIEWAAMQAVAAKLGIGTTETLRKWVRQDQIDAGTRPGTTTEESAELKRLKKENAELKRANEILKAAAVRSMGRCNIPGRTAAGGVAGWRESGVRGCRTSKSVKCGDGGGTGSR